MARGLSDKQVYDKIYRRLHHFKAYLHRYGIQCEYHNRSLFGPEHDNSNWCIYYVRQDASNGETALFEYARIRGQVYRGFKDGIKAIVSEFGNIVTVG